MKRIVDGFIVGMGAGSVFSSGFGLSLPVMLGITVGLGLFNSWLAKKLAEKFNS